MSRTPSEPIARSSGPDPGGYVEELDPANQSLADALRRSFGILKLLMLALLVLYFLSGAFSVKQGEVGLVLRCGRIVGAGGYGRDARTTGATTGATGGAVLVPGWHWSWPYPFERWIKVPANERQMPVEFMFQLSKAEKASGTIKGYKSDSLSPLRDDYLITGDVNIIHASLWVKYKITDPVAYVSNVYPRPDPKADVRSKAYRRYAEYTILATLVRDAVIETAAGREALSIRGEGQDAFLFAVGVRIREKLKELEAAGASLGISVDARTGIIAPKAKGVEAIMPPRQTQQVFDQVLATQTQKSVEITKARSKAMALLVNTAGPQYVSIGEAIEEEFDLMRALSKAESAESTGETPVPPTLTPTLTPTVRSLRAAVDRQRREVVEPLLTKVATGDVRAIIREAETARDRTIKEAAGDYQQFIAVRPEYLRNPSIFMSRLLDETYARALDSRRVAKLYVPPEYKEVRLRIPRSGQAVLESEEEKRERDAGTSTPAGGFR